MSKPIYLFSISSHPDAISINSLDITFFHPQINFSQYDYLILTSKQAVKALEQYEQKEYIGKKALCISKQTAKSYKDIGGQVLEMGSGYGDDIKLIIKKYPKETKWLYLRAEVVASDFATVLHSQSYSIHEVILYKSACSAAMQHIKLPVDATLIFTSPSSVKCFLEHHTIEENMQVIVIGKTTAKALPKQIKYKIAKEKTIQSCLEELQ